jgi:hypothetical protein
VTRRARVGHSTLDAESAGILNCAFDGYGALLSGARQPFIDPSASLSVVEMGAFAYSGTHPPGTMNFGQAGVQGLGNKGRAPIASVRLGGTGRFAERRVSLKGGRSSAAECLTHHLIGPRRFRVRWMGRLLVVGA